MGAASLKERIGDALEEAYPGQVTRDANVITVNAKVDEDTPLPLGNTKSRRGVDDRLRLLIERVERLEEEKAGIADDIRDVFLEAKAVGYDPKIMRQVIKLRKMKPDVRSEQETLLDTYKSALGMA